MIESWLPLGTNFYRISADIIEIELHGRFTMDDANEYIGMLDSVARQHGYTLTLFNMNDADPLPPEVRRFLGQYSNRTESPAGIVHFGGGIAQRLLGRLVIRGINLMRKTPLWVDFLDEKEDAEEWLQNRRRQILSGFEKQDTQTP